MDPERELARYRANADCELFPLFRTMVTFGDSPRLLSEVEPRPLPFTAWKPYDQLDFAFEVLVETGLANEILLMGGLFGISGGRARVMPHPTDLLARLTPSPSTDIVKAAVRRSHLVDLGDGVFRVGEGDDDIVYFRVRPVEIRPEPTAREKLAEFLRSTPVAMLNWFAWLLTKARLRRRRVEPQIRIVDTPIEPNAPDEVPAVAS